MTLRPLAVNSYIKLVYCSNSCVFPYNSLTRTDTWNIRKQVAVATAQILFHRFWFVTSMKQFGIGVRRAVHIIPITTLTLIVQDVGMGALYLASKLEECPLRMRDLINVYDLLLQRTTHTLALYTSPNA